MRLKHFHHFLTLTLFLFILSVTNAFRCYQCEFKRCPTLANCKEQVDICTINNFDRWQVRQVECPGMCETHLTTDATGRIIQWHRGCAPAQELPRGTPYNFCTTTYRVGIKEDRCTCSGDLCNGASGPKSAKIVQILSLLIVFFVFRIHSS
ncbi:uncharacterized protein LOC141852947 [Brevipalpus obovatus]|uniref:uncharacterized protein LOC141852947 n=1 Tax=Brevipalpus obovatus TaxID=246614 RepID=UPI003D9DD662